MRNAIVLYGGVWLLCINGFILLVELYVAFASTMYLYLYPGD